MIPHLASKSALLGDREHPGACETLHGLETGLQRCRVNVRPAPIEAEGSDRKIVVKLAQSIVGANRGSAVRRIGEQMC